MEGDDLGGRGLEIDVNGRAEEGNDLGLLGGHSGRGGGDSVGSADDHAAVAEATGGVGGGRVSRAGGFVAGGDVRSGEGFAAAVGDDTGHR